MTRALWLGERPRTLWAPFFASAKEDRASVACFDLNLMLNDLPAADVQAFPLDALCQFPYRPRRKTSRMDQKMVRLGQESIGMDRKLIGLDRKKIVVIRKTIDADRKMITVD
jgi:hypothetical protein